jgi:hypothetical protein
VDRDGADAPDPCALSIWWWPALLISVATFVTGILRTRAATTTLCLLVETAADLHGATLAEQLRRPLTFTIGNDISALLRKDDKDRLDG